MFPPLTFFLNQSLHHFRVKSRGPGEQVCVRQLIAAHRLFLAVGRRRANNTVSTHQHKSER